MKKWAVSGEGEEKKTKVRKRTGEVRKTKIETGGPNTRYTIITIITSFMYSVDSELSIVKSYALQQCRGKESVMPQLTHQKNVSISMIMTNFLSKMSYTKEHLVR